MLDQVVSSQNNQRSGSQLKAHDLGIAKSPSGSVAYSEANRSQDKARRKGTGEQIDHNGFIFNGNGMKGFSVKSRVSPQPSPIRTVSAKGSDLVENKFISGEKINEALNRITRASTAFHKYERYANPKNQECALQSQALESELKNLETMFLNLQPPTMGEKIGAQSNSIQTPASTTSKELQKQLSFMSKEKAKLEKKCEDRKGSIKKLYYIVLEKEKQLRQCWDAIKTLREALVTLEDTAQQDMMLKVQRILGYEKRIENLDQLVQNLNEGLIGSFSNEEDRKAGLELLTNRGEILGCLADIRDILEIPQANPTEILETCLETLQRVNIDLAHHQQNEQKSTSRLEGALKESAVKANQYDKTIEEIRRLKEDKAKETYKLKEHLSEVNNKLYDREKEFIEEQELLKDKINELEIELKKARGAQVPSKASQDPELSSKLLSSQRLIHEQAAALESIQVELRGLRDETAEKSQTIASLKQKLSTEVSTGASHKSTIASLSQQLEAVKSELNSASQKLENLQDRKEQSQVLIRVQAELKQALADLRERDSSIMTLKQQQAADSSTLATQQTTINLLTNQLEKAKSQLSRSEERSMAFVDSQRQAEAEMLANAQLQIQKLTTELNGHESTILSLKQRLASESSHITSQQTLAVISTQQLQQTQSELAKAQVRCSNLENEVKLLKEQHSDLKKNHDAEMEKLRIRLKTAEEAKIKHDETIKHFALEKIDLQGQVADLQMSLSAIERERRSSKKNNTDFPELQPIIHEHDAEEYEIGEPVETIADLVGDYAPHFHGDEEPERGQYGVQQDENNINEMYAYALDRISEELQLTLDRKKNLSEEIAAAKASVKQQFESAEKDLRRQVLEGVALVSSQYKLVLSHTADRALRAEIERNQLKDELRIVEDLHEAKRHLEKKVEEANRKVTTHAEENVHISASYNERLSMLEEHHKSTLDDLNKLLKENKELSDNLNAKDTENGELRALVSSMNEKANSASSKRPPLPSVDKSPTSSQELTTLQKEIQELNSEVDSKNNEITSLKQKLITAEQVCSKHKLESYTSGQKSAELMIQISKLTSELESQRKAHKDATLKIEAELDNLKKEKIAFEIESTSKIAKLEASNAQHVTRNQDLLDSSFLKAKIDLAALRVEFDSLILSQTASQAMIRSMKDELNARNSQFKAIEEEATKEQEDAARMIEELTSRISELEAVQSGLSAVQKSTPREDPAHSKAHRSVGPLHSPDQDADHEYGDRLETFQGEEEQEDLKGENDQKAQQEGEEDPNENLYKEFSRLFLSGMFLKRINNTLNKQIFILRLKFNKARNMAAMSKRLQNHNATLENEVMKITHKLMETEVKKSELEDQLALRENQLEEAICSRTIRSELRSGIQDDDKNRRTALGKSKDESKSQMTQYFFETLVMLKQYFDFEIPPIDDPSSREWDSFVKILKAEIRKGKTEKDDMAESIKYYKQLLDARCLEVTTLQDKIQEMNEIKAQLFDRDQNLSLILPFTAGVSGVDVFDKKKLDSLLNDSDFKYEDGDQRKDQKPGKDGGLNLSQEVISRQEAELLKDRLTDIERDYKDYRRSSELAVENLRRDADTLRMENEFLVIKIKELESENERLERTEDAFLTQFKIQKQEMEDLRTQLRMANGDLIKQHLKSSFLNWLDSMAKGKKEEATTICTLLQTQMEMKPNEKADFVANLNKLNLKKKTI